MTSWEWADGAGWTLTWLDVGVVGLFGGYSLIGWSLLPRTWRGEVPAVARVRETGGARGAWLRLWYRFATGRTSVVSLLTATDLLLTHLAIRVDDRDSGPAYVASGAGLVLFGVLALLWMSVAGFGRPRSLIPPHLRDEGDRTT